MKFQVKQTLNISVDRCVDDDNDNGNTVTVTATPSTFTKAYHGVTRPPFKCVQISLVSLSFPHTHKKEKQNPDVLVDC